MGSVVWMLASGAVAEAGASVWRPVTTISISLDRETGERKNRGGVSGNHDEVESRAA
jgi:hypothetical protein